MPQEFHADDATADEGQGSSTSHDDTVLAGTPVVVRRAAGLAALIGAAASAVAIAYLWRASQTMAALDWGLCVLMTGVAAVYLATLVDSRTPLLVADDLGVRIRLGHEWRGLPWEAVDTVLVRPRRGLFHDGRITFAPHSLGRALDGLDARGRRHARVNQKMYGAALAVPVGITTRISTADERSVVAELTALAHGRAEVVEQVSRTATTADGPGVTTGRGTRNARGADTGVEEAAPRGTVTDDRADADWAADWADDWADSRHGDVVTHEDAATSEDDLAAADITIEPAADAGAESGAETTAAEHQPAPRRSILGGIGTIVSRVAKGRRHDIDAAHDTDVALDTERLGAATGTGSVADPAALVDVPEPSDERTSAVPLRSARPALRAQVTRDGRSSLGNTALDDAPVLPEGRDLRRPGSVDLVMEPAGASDAGRVRPISTIGDAVEPLVIDDFVTEPAYDPVIGPELAAARTRLGLTVDDLADRTRIRPHVIESIEVDDFAPCGGDFYARGHLRTLARVLGKDPAPLLASFEERYATAPVNARRVFEAELATGMTGSMRSTIGGPNWGLLVGVVISLVLVWGVVRLFAGEPADLVQEPPPVLNGSAGIGNGYAAPQDDAAPVAKPLPVLLTAAFGDTRVVVRDGDGQIVFSGEMVLGEKKRLEVTPPVRIRAQDGGAVEVAVHGRERGVLGETGEPGRRTFG